LKDTVKRVDKLVKPLEKERKKKEEKKEKILKKE